MDSRLVPPGIFLQRILVMSLQVAISSPHAES